MAKPSEVKNGNIVRFDGELYTVAEIIHRTPGNLRAFYQAKMKSVKSGKQAEYRFRVDEDIEVVRVEGRKFQFVYKDSDFFVCMDNETFEQLPVSGSAFGHGAKYLKEGMEVQLNFEEDEILSADAPVFVELEITYTEPGVRGDTVNNVLKPATLETGAEVRVPLFVNIGDKIKIDTRTEEYVSRV